MIKDDLELFYRKLPDARDGRVSAEGVLRVVCRHLLNAALSGDVQAQKAVALAHTHAAGLAHSDLSYKNVLIDPVSQSAAIIDIDGLVVPGKFPPDVVGTPDFIAPEVYATMNLQKNDPNRKLPSQTTDRHALAALIYEYLLYRHPLRGKKVWDIDDECRDGMGNPCGIIQ